MRTGDICVAALTLRRMWCGAIAWAHLAFLQPLIGGARLFSLIGRFVSYILGNELFYHMVYVDDLNGAFLGDRKFVNLLVWILAFEVAGTLFGYHKFSGGITVSFLGY